MNWFNKIQSLFQKKKSVNYNTLKMVELKTIAKEKGLKGYAKLRKADLITLLKINS
jgi:hypothetical protein